MEETDKKLSEVALMPEEEKEPGSFRLVFTLGLAGFLSGVVLVTVFLITKPMIEANKAAAIEKAIYKVLPGCSSFETLVLNDGKLEKEALRTGKEEKDKGEKAIVYVGFDNTGKLIGFAIQGAQSGFQDIIALMVGFEAANKTIIGYEVLESKETPGLGDKIFKDEDFVANFKALTVEPEIFAVKKGEKKNPNEVETIAGATISSKVIVKILNQAVTDYKDPILDYVQNMNVQNAQVTE
jgi:Na+-translocating ferredoxin:NAD+ oxidoreductase subunit G